MIRGEMARSTTEVPTRPFGRTGIPVSILALGGWHLGLPKTQKEATRLVHAAISETRDAGLRVMATCPYWKKWLTSHHDFDDIVDQVTMEAVHAVREAQS